MGLQQKKKKKKEWLLPYPRPNVTFGCAVRIYYLLGTSLAVQGLRLSAFTARGTGQIPGQGTKIPHASRCGQKEKGMWSKLSLAHLLSRTQKLPFLGALVSVFPVSQTPPLRGKVRWGSRKEREAAIIWEHLDVRIQCWHPAKRTWPGTPDI